MPSYVEDGPDLLPHVQIKHKTGNYNYNGRKDELTISVYEFDATFADYLPHLPVLTETGEVAAVQPKPPRKQPVGWWKAQCVFRGLEGKGTIDELQNQLRGHENDPLRPEIPEIREKARIKWKVDNKAARDKNWRKNMEKEEKLEEDPRRFFEETFPAGGKEKSEEIFVIKNKKVADISKIAEDLKLICESTKGPIDEVDWIRVHEDWIVVGQDKKLVVEKIRSINREAGRALEQYQEERQTLKRKQEQIKLQQR